MATTCLANPAADVKGAVKSTGTEKGTVNGSETGIGTVRPNTTEIGIEGKTGVGGTETENASIHDGTALNPHDTPRTMNVPIGRQGQATKTVNGIVNIRMAIHSLETTPLHPQLPQDPPKPPPWKQSSRSKAALEAAAPLPSRPSSQTCRRLHSPNRLRPSSNPPRAPLPNALTTGTGIVAPDAVPRPLSPQRPSLLLPRLLLRSTHTLSSVRRVTASAC